MNKEHQDLLAEITDDKLNFDDYAARGKKLFALVKKKSAQAAKDMAEHQLAILGMMRRVRFEGLKARVANRNINYRKHQIRVIAKRLNNRAAYEQALHLNQLASDALTILEAVATGIIL